MTLKKVHIRFADGKQVLYARRPSVIKTPSTHDRSQGYTMPLLYLVVWLHPKRMLMCCCWLRWQSRQVEFRIHFLFCNGSQVNMPHDLHTVAHFSPYTAQWNVSLTVPAFPDVSGSLKTYTEVCNTGCSYSFRNGSRLPLCYTTEVVPPPVAAYTNNTLSTSRCTPQGHVFVDIVWIVLASRH